MKRFAFAAAFVLSAFLVVAQDLKTIDVASDEWADCTLKDGSGLYFDVMRLVYGPQGSKLAIKIVPFARSVQMLESGKTDICVGIYQGDVTNGIYPKYPIDFDDLTVMMLKSKVADYKGEASLKDKKVAWIVDYAYDKYLSVPVKLTEVSDTASGIKMLQSGRVDYYIETKSTITPALGTLGISEGAFHLDTVKWVRLYLGFAKNDKGKALQAIWDKRMPVLFKSGELQKAFDKWGFQESYEKLKKDM
ncbi:MAG TPA: transporter substrate-binding domain-containing protein [Rectinemataceae bacterium]|nr:transporter substrate-binding domain-containing protein [Rectinemataceae bacterium]